jgi:hypothetical protein
MSAIEHKTFIITPRRNEAGRWIARIGKIDGSKLRSTLPNSTGSRPWLDTEPPTYSAEAAIQLAKDANNGGNIQ